LRAPWRHQRPVAEPAPAGQVNGIQTHQRLTALDGLAGIDQTFKDFTLHSETEIALRSGDHAGKAREASIALTTVADLTSGGCADRLCRKRHRRPRGQTAAGKRQEGLI
jgi:hypothetical protein